MNEYKKTEGGECIKVPKPCNVKQYRKTSKGKCLPIPVLCDLDQYRESDDGDCIDIPLFADGEDCSDDRYCKSGSCDDTTKKCVQAADATATPPAADATATPPAAGTSGFVNFSGKMRLYQDNTLFQRLLQVGLFILILLLLFCICKRIKKMKR